MSLTGILTFNNLDIIVWKIL